MYKCLINYWTLKYDYVCLEVTWMLLVRLPSTAIFLHQLLWRRL
jgi:hypothetical protein